MKAMSLILLTVGLTFVLVTATFYGVVAGFIAAVAAFFVLQQYDAFVSTAPGGDKTPYRAFVFAVVVIGYAIGLIVRAFIDGRCVA